MVVESNNKNGSHKKNKNNSNNTSNNNSNNTSNNNSNELNNRIKRGNIRILGNNNKNNTIYNGFIGRTGANIRKYFEMTVNDVLKNTGFRFKILNRYALNKKYNGITILNHLKEIVPWVMPENKLLPMAFCMYTTDDYENNKWSEPLTMILIGTTNILLKQSVKNCIQIMFSFNNKKKNKTIIKCTKV